MKEFLTPDSIANTIRMAAFTRRREIGMKGSFAGVFLIVEGPDDARLFKMFSNQETCKIEMAFGKHNATKAVELLQETGFDRAIAIVDRDFDTILGRMQNSDRLFYTDTHDIETLIIKSPAFDKLIAEYAKDDLLREFESHSQKSLRQTLLEPAHFIGLLRCVSIQNQLNLSFKEVDLDNYLEKDTLQINKNAFIRRVLKTSHASDIHPKELKKKIAELEALDHDPWIMARGHDLVSVLLRGFHVFGYRSAQRLSANALESSLRLSFSFDAFQETILYKDVKNWEKENSKYQIFR